LQFNFLKCFIFIILQRFQHTLGIPGFVVFALVKKLLWVVLLFTTTVFAQKENKYIRQGNDSYYENNFKDAEVDYMKALEKTPESAKGQYNLGGALYKQETLRMLLNYSEVLQAGTWMIRQKRMPFTTLAMLF